MTRSKLTASPWGKAASLVELYAAQPAKADTLLGEINYQSATERRRCQFLFYGVLRHRRRIDSLLSRLISRRPKPRLLAMLQVAVYEMLEAGPERQPKVVDYAVGQIRAAMSKSEAGLANAVLRKIPAENAKLEKDAPAAIRLSHPEWLAEKWTEQFGAEAAEKLMTWNLQPPEVVFRVRDAEAVATAQAEQLFLKETAWPGYLSLAGEFALAEPLFKTGALYAQDPSTRLATDALAVQPGESVLDLCASPGGKALMLADALGRDSAGLLVAVDLPGPRLEQLDENLRKLDSGNGPAVRLLPADVFELSPQYLEQEGLPPQFDAVLLDAPCSNTGVLRRRPDAKWRIEEGDIIQSATLQLELLRQAADLVKPGGRLVYSTCSIEPEENQGVVETFFDTQEAKGFTLVSQTTSLPWETAHDGAGVAILQRDNTISRRQQG